MSRNPSPNLSNSLVGQAPGIIAVQRSGEPGRDQSDIFIRGVGTTGNSSPLYVIDGIVSSQSDFAQINSNEIASVSVLKDAASAAVFGVRGGNGIILVTTKRGVSGRTQFSYNVNYGIQQRTRIPSYVGSYDFATLFNEARINDGGEALFTPDDLQKFKDGSDPDGHPNTDWFSTVLKKTAPMKQHTLSANGGTEKARYALSLSYLDQDGVYTGNGFKRYNFRSNLDADATNTTRISFDLAGRSENIFAPSISSGDLFNALGRVRPIDAAVFTNGKYAATIQGNPLAYIQPSEGYNRNNTWGMRARAQILQTIPFVKGLSIKGIAAFNKSFGEEKAWSSPSIGLYSYNPADKTYTETTPPNPPSLRQNNRTNQDLTVEAHLNYERLFGDHRVSGLVLYTETEERFSGLGARREQYTIRLDEINIGPVNPFTGNSGFSGSSGRRGYVGRFNYTYMDKYILETSFRRDASEQFEKSRRWGFFPSVSAGWVLTNEAFFPKTRAVNFLKLRGSWGILGNDRFNSNRFLYITAYQPAVPPNSGDPNSAGNPAIFGDNVAQQTIFEGRLGNPNVTWETVKKLDIGIDATLYNGLFNITADYFLDKRDDILANRSASVPGLAGFELPIENLAKVTNKGIDLAISHRNTISRSFTYNLTANFTYARNKITYIDEPAGVNPNIARTGRSLNSQFGYKAIGLFQDTTEIANAPTQTSLGGAPKPGDLRYADISGPDGKPDGVIDANDLTYIGRSNIPEIIYGLAGGVGFKGIELSFLFQGSAHASQYLSNETAFPFFNGGKALKENFDRWTPATPNGRQPRVTLNTGSPNYQTSSFWLEDASYLRLRSVELAYTIPKSLSNIIRLQGLRVYANANNVFTLANIENFDPENSQSRGWAYPQLRVFNFGATIQF
jgi:TonB-linked SusC/RagA family outer membrane protein